jgi:hypothetical protein
VAKPHARVCSCSGAQSLGFFHTGDGVSLNSCDTASGVYPGQRLCWHASSEQINSGYRLGTLTGLGSAHTRVILQGGPPVPSSSPTPLPTPLPSPLPTRLPSSAPTAAPTLGMPSYVPDGPQVNVPVSTVTSSGWTVCWSSLYSSTEPLSSIFAACNGNNLMYAGYDNNAPSTYITLAWGPRNLVIGGGIQTFGSTQFYYR